MKRLLSSILPSARRPAASSDPAVAAARAALARMPHVGASGLANALYAADVVCVARAGRPLRDLPLDPPPSASTLDAAAAAIAAGPLAASGLPDDQAAIVAEVADRAATMRLGEILAVAGPPWSLRYAPRGNRRPTPARSAA